MTDLAIVGNYILDDSIKSSYPRKRECRTTNRMDVICGFRLRKETRSTSRPPCTKGDRRMIQLGRNGIEWSKDDEWRALQEEMRTTHCVLLKDFLAPSLISLVRPLLTTNRFLPFEHVGQKGRILARERRLEATDPLARLLTFCLNSTRLYRTVGDLTGLGEDIQYFFSRCYKMFPDSDDFQSWHNDCDDSGGGGTRLLGMSINLSTEPVQGREFQIRDRSGSRKVHRTIKSHFGAARLFRIDKRLEHRALPPKGTVPRLSCGGWFFPHRNVPDPFRLKPETARSAIPRTRANVGIDGVEGTRCRD